MEMVGLYPQLVGELEKEQRYLGQGGTRYRQTTVQMSLQVAEKTKTLRPFFNRQEAKRVVESVFPHADEHRVNDVAKMLNVVAKELRLKSNLSDEALAYVRKKKAQRKKLAFVQN